MRTRRMGAHAALLITAILAAGGLSAVDAQAAVTVGTGTQASCTEAALDAALAGGGTITFNCGGAATITVTSTKTVSQNTTIKGGGNITLSGGGTTQVFRLAALTTLALTDITVTDGFSTSSGGAIAGSGTLKLTRAVIQNSKTGPGSCGGAISMDSTGKLGLTDSTLELNSGGFGGAVCTGGSLTSTRSHLVFNHATGSGGAVYLFPNAVMNMNGGDLNGNSATIGGAVILAGNAAKVTLRSTGQPISISANQATDSGGAIYNDPTNVQGYLKISHANFTGNAVPPNVLLSGYGGAIADRGAGMVLTDSTFRQNQGRFGGAVFVGNGQSGPTASIQRVTFDQNVVSRLGGGLYANFGAVATLTDATFTSNQAAAGGAVARFAATLTILNSSMTSNTATQNGGGLYNDSGPQPTVGGYTEIHDSTIAANQAPLGGGMFNNAEANLSNVTVLNNSGGLYSSSTGAINRLHNTVLQNPGSDNCVITGSAPASAGGNYATDLSCHLNQLSTDRQGAGLNALLGPLTNDGPNTTWYAMPQTSSPLINKAVARCSATDQRHAARPDVCDIGAVEFGGIR